jgi:glutamyl-tRNA synthetase
MTADIRVRFAPSPTGPLHIGGVRTALYNYLFALKNKGTFILRIEDTDHSRFVAGAEEYILQSLKWLGITYTEGPGTGGPYAPYRQSDRKDIYRDYALSLVQKGFAYYAFDTPEELEAMRKSTADGIPLQYNAITRKRMKNSFSMSTDESSEWIHSGKPYVIRIKIPEQEIIEFDDLIRGHISVHSEELDDKVLFKSDGMPTYHLANVTDDYLMKISHVIRGEEWLPSAPLHVLLYRYFGWEDVMPQFAHLPLLLKPDGNGKLSKRDGDRLGFPVFPLSWTDPVTGECASGYRESGYLPDAVINILALLGWNSGTDEEMFSLEDLIKQFSLEHVHKAGAKFDPEKAKWFNHQYIQTCSDEQLAAMLVTQLEALNVKPEPQMLIKVISLVKNRITLLPDFTEQAGFFFSPPSSYDEKTVSEKWKPDSAVMVKGLLTVLAATEPFEKQILEQNIKSHIEKNQLGMGQVMNTLRLLLVGANKGPGLFDIMEVLGKEEVLERIRKGVESLK